MAEFINEAEEELAKRRFNAGGYESFEAAAQSVVDERVAPYNGPEFAQGVHDVAPEPAPEPETVSEEVVEEATDEPRAEESVEESSDEPKKRGRS